MSSTLFTFLGIVSEKYVQLLNFNTYLKNQLVYLVNCYDNEYEISCLVSSITTVAIVLNKDKQVYTYPDVVLTNKFTGASVETNIANMIDKIKQLNNYLTNFCQYLFQVEDVVTRLLITNQLNEQLLTLYDVDFLNLKNSISSLSRKDQFVPIINSLNQIKSDIMNGVKNITIPLSDRVSYTNQINSAILNYVNGNTINNYLQELLKISYNIDDIIQFVGENPSEITTKVSLREIQYAQRTAQQNYTSTLKANNISLEPECNIGTPLTSQACIDKFNRLKEERDKVQKKIIYDIQKEERDRRNKKNLRDKQIKDILANLPPVDPFQPDKINVTGKMGSEIYDPEDINSEIEKQEILDNINNNPNLTDEERTILTNIIDLGISDFYLLKEINDTSSFNEIVQIINEYIDECQL